MNRWPGHYMKPGTRVSTPGSVFAVVIEDGEEWGCEKSSVSTRGWRAGYVAHSHYDHGRWTNPVVWYVGTGEELRGKLDTLAIRERKNWVVCPNVLDALTLSGWFTHADRSGMRWAPRPGTKAATEDTGQYEAMVSVRKLSLNPKVPIVDYSQNGLRWLWVQGSNYFTVSEEELSQSLNWNWTGERDWDNRKGTPNRNPDERCLMWLSAFQRLSDWWRGTALAPFGPTAGTCAMGILRTHIEARTLSTHSNAAAHELERSAAFGGRASTWFYGNIGLPSAHATAICPAPAASKYPAARGPAIMLDVRSMYPFLLSTRPFPCRLCHHSSRVPRHLPQSLRRHWGVIARVVIRTSVPEYPFRDGVKVSYPIGEFETVLTGPELDTLRHDGRVLECREMCLYKLNTPFQLAAQTMIDARQKARAKGESAWELFVKLVSNAMAGKLAQRSGRWSERRKLSAPQRWGEWVEKGKTPDTVRRFRAVGGLVWEWVTDELPSGPYTAAFAYLTAYGRVMMRRLRELCPPRSVYSQDTDGIWVSPLAERSLRDEGVPFGEDAGELKVAQVAEAARWYGPRHYWTPGQWVLAGMATANVQAGGLEVVHAESANPLSARADGPPALVRRVTRRSMLDVQPDPGRIDRDGWHHPQQLG